MLPIDSDSDLNSESEIELGSETLAVDSEAGLISAELPVDSDSASDSEGSFL